MASRNELSEFRWTEETLKLKPLSLQDNNRSIIARIALQSYSVSTLILIDRFSVCELYD